MSSRAAASRKRLVPGENQRPASSPSKGFFSRSKSKPPTSPLNAADKNVAASTSQPPPMPVVNFEDDSPVYDPFRSDYLPKAEAPSFKSERSRTASFGNNSRPAPGVYQSQYPLPHASQEYQQQTIRVNSRGDGTNDYSNGNAYIEASYQPPPPVQASYQSPPSRTSRRHGVTDFNKKPSYSLTDQAPPRTNMNNPFSMPSPASPPSEPYGSPRSSRASPTPTEPPTYSSVHEVQHYAPVLQDGHVFSFPIPPSSSHPRDVYHQQYNPRDYPTPPSSSSQRFAPAPLYIPEKTPSYSPASQHDSGQQWNRPYEQDRSRLAAASISGSSDSSESLGRGGASSATAPTFVFPGSRSVARPKAGKKAKGLTGKLADGNQSPLAHNGSDSSLPSTPAGQTIVFQSDRQPFRHGEPQHPEPLSAFSDGSGGQSPIAGPSHRSMSPDRSPSNPVKVYPMGRSSAKPRVKAKDTEPRSSKSSASSSMGDKERSGRSKLMGFIKRKKSDRPMPTISHSASSFSLSSGSDFESNKSTTNFQTPPSTAPTSIYEDANAAEEQSRPQAKRPAPSRAGYYPLDPYDPILLDNDRQTGELLAHVNPTNSPSFHNYGNNPPNAVLDLGCGQGHWVVDAAIAWKGYGTQVTGYDMIDLSQSLLPWAAENGVRDSVRFVRGNFLKQRLPFSDNTFDLVRMSCLALCITEDSWPFVLQEVCRVLVVGGRLEVIDDHIFFPYGKNSVVSDSFTRPSNISINNILPSPPFSTFNIHDGKTANPGLGPRDEDEEDFLELYKSRDDDVDNDDTITLNGRDLDSTSGKAAPARPSSPAISTQSWNRAQATSGDLEALFDHMLMHKFGIKKDVHNFALDMMKRAFGYSREVTTMHIVLAPPGTTISEKPDAKARSTPIPNAPTSLSRCPGLILLPSTFIPLAQSKVEILASKHLRMLLACKNHLLEHAIEATDDAEIDEASMREAIWEYEGFLRHRFKAPITMGEMIPEEVDDDFDTQSISESICSNHREEMWEIQSEFREHFGWQRPLSPKDSIDSRSPTPVANAPSKKAVARRSSASKKRISNVAPPKEELTHIRTFRVYEAIKIDKALFGSSM